MVLDLPVRAVFTRVSDGNPLRRLDVRSKAREIGIVFSVLRHDGLLFYWDEADMGLGEEWQESFSYSRSKTDPILGLNNRS